MSSQRGSGNDAGSAAAGTGRPALRLVHGSVDGADVTVELAALVAVLAARGSVVEPEPVPRRLWNDPERQLRRPLRIGRDSWRRSGLPS